MLMDKLQTQDQGAIYRASDRRLEAISLATGEVAWQVDIEKLGRSGLMGLIESDDSLYLLTESTLQQYAKEDGREGWKVKDGFRKYKGIDREPPTFFSQEGKVFVIGAYHDRIAYDAATGNEVWKKDSGMELR
jgi:outer membrane protein assembly factor BamB